MDRPVHGVTITFMNMGVYTEYDGDHGDHADCRKTNHTNYYAHVYHSSLNIIVLESSLEFLWYAYIKRIVGQVGRLSLLDDHV